MLKVKIVKGRQGWWYESKVGKIYKVKEVFDGDYVSVYIPFDGSAHLHKQDITFA